MARSLFKMNEENRFLGDVSRPDQSKAKQSALVNPQVDLSEIETGCDPAACRQGRSLRGHPRPFAAAADTTGRFSFVTLDSGVWKKLTRPVCTS